MIQSSIPSTKATIVGDRNEWLDCLRGYAVIIVCISHFLYLPPVKHSLPYATRFFKGDIGVWMFYVLSGYLIAGLLFREKSKQGGISLFRFYGRRFTRLLPTYLLFVIAMWTLGYKAMIDSGIPIWAFFVPWIDMIDEIGYLPYHLRTLHIEEKFYLVWGILATFLPKRVLLWLAISLLFYGPVARVVVFLPGGPRTLMFDSAADCFGIGILLAFFRFESLQSRSYLVRILNHFICRPPFLIVAMMTIGALRTVKPFSYPLVPFLPTIIGLLTAVLLISGWQQRSHLQLAWISKLGLASYTIYLFQQLVLCPWNEIYSWEFSWTRWGVATVAAVLFVWFWFMKVESRVTMWGRRKFAGH